MTPTRRQPRRRWFLISVRGLMLVVMVVGGGVGYLAHLIRTQRAMVAAVGAIKAARGRVLYDYQFATDPRLQEQRQRDLDPPAPRWLRRWLGDDWFRTVAFVRLAGPITPELLGQVGRLDGLVAVQLDAPTRLDGGWPVLARLRRLETVTLGGPGATDEALGALDGTAGLRTIELNDTAVTDAGIAGLARFRDLRSLTVRNCPRLTDAGIARLLTSGAPLLDDLTWQAGPTPAPQTLLALARHHPGLRRLSLVGCPVRDADLAPLGTLARLTTLNLQQTRVTDAGLVHLEPLLGLEALTINLPAVTDAGMTSVARLVNLRSLDLARSRVGDAGLARLDTLTHLTDLRLNRTRITDASAPVLGRLTALQTLMLNQTAVTDAALGHFHDLRSLQILGLGGTTVTSEALADLRAALPNLRGPAALRVRSSPPRSPDRTTQGLRP